MAFLLGSLVNFFYYDVLSQLAVPAYSLSIVFLLIGNGINAAAVALILSLNIVTFPVGGLVLAVSQVTNSAYGKCRQGLDLSLIHISAERNDRFYLHLEGRRYLRQPGRQAVCQRTGSARRCA